MSKQLLKCLYLALFDLIYVIYEMLFLGICKFLFGRGVLDMEEMNT
jgi:hypothetical protein